MPVIESSAYKAPVLLRNGHVQTVVPSLFRRPGDPEYSRERLELSDGDFLDLDWARTGSSRLVVISHGLEGNSSKAYVRGMANALRSAGWDVLAWNFRGCSKTPNRLPRLYHNGDMRDLAAVVEHGTATGNYGQVGLVGFSMGGNITLNYLGHEESQVHPKVSAAVGVSVPCDLKGAAMELARPVNRVYMRYFFKSLRAKLKEKHARYPDLFEDPDDWKVKDFHGFDDRYTAPVHGFASARDYWAKTSSLGRLAAIRVPTLLLSALDDPFLSTTCYPVTAAAGSPALYLEAPRYGGHVGFMSGHHTTGVYWSEQRAVEFLTHA